MNSINITRLVDAQACSKKNLFKECGFSTNVNKGYMLAKVLKNILKSQNFTEMKKQDIYDELIKNIEKTWFLSTEERNIEIETLLKQIYRYQCYEIVKNSPILARDVFHTVIINGQNIDVSADIVFEREDRIEVIKYKKGAPTLSARAKEGNRPDNSIELFLMQKMGEELYCKKGLPIMACFYHMKAKSDKSNEFELLFDKKEGQNIVSTWFDFSPSAFLDAFEKVRNMEELISRLIATESKPVIKSECAEKHCEDCPNDRICHYKKPLAEQPYDVVEEVEKISGGKHNPTPEQKSLINFTRGYARCNATAGSGKSTTIVHRTINLMQQGCLPEDILLITFTTKGCQELREKIEYWAKALGVKNANRVKIYTFNGFGQSIIETEFKRLGFEEKPQLADKIERYDLILKLLEEFPKIEDFDYKNPLMNLPYATGVVISVDALFNKMKSKNYKTVEAFQEDTGISPEAAKIVWDMYYMFCIELIEQGLIQYQDQLKYAMEILVAFPEIRRANSLKHIMIDEFQDTDVVQMEMIKLFTRQSKFESLVVVGDDSQAIYGFREVTADNILDFKNTFKTARDIYLVHNFRSTPQIVAVANALNNLNRRRVDKAMISTNADGPTPMLVNFKEKDRHHEYLWIVEQIKKCVNEKNVPYEEIAVLARTKTELAEIEETLKENGIPAYVESTELLINNANVKMILSFAEFLDNPNNDLNFLEYRMMFDSEQLSEMEAEGLKKYVDDKKAEFMSEYSSISSPYEKLLYVFKCLEPIAAVDKVVEEFVEVLKEKNFKSIDKLVDYMKKFALFKDDKAVTKAEIKYKAVVLTTVHSSKGKEFDTVFTTLNGFKYMVKGMSEDDLEEERRLLFVALTRAKKELFITETDRKGLTEDITGFAEELTFVKKVEVCPEEKAA